MIDMKELDVRSPKTMDNETSTREGGMTIVLHHNGKRLVFSKRILNKIGNTRRIKFGFAGDYLILIGSNEEGFLLRNMNKHKVIYNASLIREILDAYGIDYTEDLCRTFSDVEEIQDMPDAIALKMKEGDG